MSDAGGGPVRTTPTVAVIGAGASGTLTAAQLARAAGAAGRRVDVLLVDPARPGTGLADVLADAVRDQPNVRLEHIALRATDVRRVGRRIRVTLSDGTYRPVDAVVLAVGHGEPSRRWAPRTLQSSPRFVADPWRGSDPDLAPGDDVVLVGAGLTAVDMALRVARPGVTVHMVSRSGLEGWPQQLHSGALVPHRGGTAAASSPPRTTAGGSPSP